jgi:hypothetical protein
LDVLELNSRLSSRCSSTSTLCSSVVNLPCGDDDPPPLPPRTRRRDSNIGFDSVLLTPPPPLDLLPPRPPPRAFELPPRGFELPPRAFDLPHRGFDRDSLLQNPPPLPPRRITLPVQDHGLHSGAGVLGGATYRRSLTTGPRCHGSSDDTQPQLPPKTYRISHMRQSSS